MYVIFFAYMILYSYFECTKLLSALHQNIRGTARWTTRQRDVRQGLETPEISTIMPCRISVRCYAFRLSLSAIKTVCSF